jgi:hypothetical protein
VEEQATHRAIEVAKSMLWPAEIYTGSTLDEYLNAYSIIVRSKPRGSDTGLRERERGIWKEQELKAYTNLAVDLTGLANNVDSSGSSLTEGSFNFIVRDSIDDQKVFGHANARNSRYNGELTSASASSRMNNAIAIDKDDLGEELGVVDANFFEQLLVVRDLTEIEVPRNVRRSEFNHLICLKYHLHAWVGANSQANYGIDFVAACEGNVEATDELDSIRSILVK